MDSLQPLKLKEMIWQTLEEKGINGLSHALLSHRTGIPLEVLRGLFPHSIHAVFWVWDDVRPQVRDISSLLERKDFSLHDRVLEILLRYLEGFAPYRSALRSFFKGLTPCYLKQVASYAENIMRSSFPLRKSIKREFSYKMWSVFLGRLSYLFLFSERSFPEMVRFCDQELTRWSSVLLTPFEE